MESRVWREHGRVTAKAFSEGSSGISYVKRTYTMNGRDDQKIESGTEEDRHQERADANPCGFEGSD
jgi:hypothetical protein